jgi:hypothetical protein
MTEPAQRLWQNILQYQVPVPGSPGLTQITLNDLIDKAPKLLLLPLNAAGIGASYQIIQGHYAAAWTAALTGVGISVLIVAARSVLGSLLARVEPVRMPAQPNRPGGRSATHG